MSNSGIDEFQHADDVDALRGHGDLRPARPARRRPRRERRADGARRAARPRATSCDSRPLIAELEAIGRAIAFAEDTGCALHIVHVSSRPRRRAGHRGARARRRRDLRDLPALPLPDAGRRRAARRRSRSARRRSASEPGLWERLGRDPHGHVRPLALVAGPQAGRVRRRLGRDRGLPDDAELLAGECEPPSARAAHLHRRRGALRHAGKGRIEPGADADLALVDLDRRAHAARARTCATVTRSPPGSAAACAPASSARCCAGAIPLPAPAASDSRNREDPVT